MFFSISISQNVSYQCDKCKSTFTQRIVYNDILSLCIKMCHTNVTNTNLHSLKKLVYKDGFSLCIKILYYSVKNVIQPSLNKSNWIFSGAGVCALKEKNYYQFCDKYLASQHTFNMHQRSKIHLRNAGITDQSNRSGLFSCPYRILDYFSDILFTFLTTFVLITKLESLSVSLSVGLSFYLSDILSTFLTTFVLITKLKSRSVFYLSVCQSVCWSVFLCFYLSDIPLTF